VSEQYAGGLAIETRFPLPGLLGGVVDSSSGSTTFYDATLVVWPTPANPYDPHGPSATPYGPPAAGITSTTVLASGSVSFSQLLGPGLFSLYTTDALTSPFKPTLLLGGTINSAVITGRLGDTTGAVNVNITYTSGAILNVAEGLPVTSTAAKPITGQLSFSVSAVTPTFSISPTSQILSPFQADATGQFSVGGPGPGDANGDTKVDINDMAIVLANYAKTAWATWRQGDFNGDGKVDINDMAIMLANYNKTSGTGLTALPEPSSALLLVLGAITLLARVWRRAQQTT
jgi:hypothetical protein